MWVAGNATDLTAQVGASAAAGALAGAHMNADLVTADTDAALAAAQRSAGALPAEGLAGRSTCSANEVSGIGSQASTGSSAGPYHRCNIEPRTCAWGSGMDRWPGQGSWVASAM